MRQPAMGAVNVGVSNLHLDLDPNSTVINHWFIITGANTTLDGIINCFIPSHKTIDKNW